MTRKALDPAMSATLNDEEYLAEKDRIIRTLLLHDTVALTHLKLLPEPKAASSFAFN
jgi:hypothetical protein